MEIENKDVIEVAPEVLLYDKVGLYAHTYHRQYYNLIHRQIFFCK